VSLKSTKGDETATVKAAPFKKPKSETEPIKSGKKPQLEVDYAIKRIRKNVEDWAKGYRDKLYTGYAECCELAFDLQHDSCRWQQFCELPFWEQRPRGRPKPGNDGKALYYVLIAAIFGIARQQVQTASKVAIALREFASNGHGTEAIVDFIKKNRGIQRLADEGPLNLADGEPSELMPKARVTSPKKSVRFVGEKVATLSSFDLNARIRIEAVIEEDVKGKRVVRCLIVEEM
jgi:hypothetical protein